MAGWSHKVKMSGQHLGLLPSSPGMCHVSSTLAQEQTARQGGGGCWGSAPKNKRLCSREDRSQTSLRSLCAAVGAALGQLELVIPAYRGRGCLSEGQTEPRIT